MSSDIRNRIKAIHSTVRGIKPDGDWVARARVMLRDHAAQDARLAAIKSNGGFFVHIFPQNFVWMRSSVMAALSIIAIVFGGSVASVSAAEDSLPGDFLYSVKLVTERARLAFTSHKEDKLKLKMEFTTRRAEDLKQVAMGVGPLRDSRVVRATEMLKSDLNTVKQQLDEINQNATPKKAAEIAKLVDTKTNELVKSLQDAKPSFHAQDQGRVVEAQAAAADASVKAIEVMAVKRQEDKSALADGDVEKAIHDHTQTVADVTGDTSLMTASSTITAQLASANTSSSTLGDAMEKIKTATILAFAAEASSTAAVVPAQGDRPLEPTAQTSVKVTATSTPDGAATATSVTITSPNSSNAEPSSTDVSP